MVVCRLRCLCYYCYLASFASPSNIIRFNCYRRLRAPLMLATRPPLPALSALPGCLRRATMRKWVRGIRYRIRIPSHPPSYYAAAGPPFTLSDVGLPNCVFDLDATLLLSSLSLHPPPRGRLFCCPCSAPRCCCRRSHSFIPPCLSPSCRVTNVLVDWTSDRHWLWCSGSGRPDCSKYL